MKKKMIPFVSLGWVCITFFLSCETNHHAEEAQLDSALEIPEKVISTKEAATLFQNDHTTRLITIGKSATTFEDKAIHFDLATLYNYINHVETIANTENIPITGISFVMGVTATGTRTTYIMPSVHNASLDYQESFTIENGQFIRFKHIEGYAQKKAISANTKNLILSPNGYLSLNEAVTQFNAYQTQYITPFASKVTRDYYTKAVWYSLDEIKEYLEYLHKKSRQHTLGITGIDVFFGVYDTNPNLELKSNAQTVFLTAHSHKKSIINSKGISFQAFIKNGFLPKEDTTDIDESLAFNLGHLSPPPPRRS